MNILLFNRYIYLGFALSCPLVYLGGLSLSSWILLSIVLRYGIKSFSWDLTAFIFFISILISSVLGFIEYLYFPVKEFFGFIVWLTLFSIAKFSLNKEVVSLSKGIAYGYFLFSLLHVLPSLSLDLGVLKLGHKFSRNAMIYQLIMFYPFYYYIIGRRNLIFMLLPLYLLLFSNGRAGFIFGVILGMYHLRKYLTVTHSRRFIKGLFIVSIFSVSYSVGVFTFEKVAPRVQSTLTQEGGLQRDKSWQIRQLMIEKAKRSFNENPFWGVGVSGFKKVDVTAADLEKFEILNGTEDYYSRKSSHNSYIASIVEFGIIGTSLFMFIVFGALKVAIRYRTYHLFLICFILVLMHAWVLNGFNGSSIWAVLGLLQNKVVYDRNILSL